MRRVSFVALSILALGWPAGRLAAQGSKADYERSANVRRATANKVFRDRIEPRWLPGNTRFWYEVSTGPGTREYVLVDAEKGVRAAAFDHEKVAALLRENGIAGARASALGLRELTWPTEGELSFATRGERWRVALADYAILERTKAEPGAAGGMAPERAPRASRRTGEESALHFVNRTPETVELWWVDLAGQARSYGQLAAGASWEQHTFGGHVWFATDASGKRLVAFEAGDQPAEAEITDKSAAGSGPARGGMAPENAPKASLRTGEQAALRFVNRTSGSVELWWLDPAGRARSYGQLEAAESREMHTFAGHVWLVTDTRGKKLVAFEAGDQAMDAEITDRSTTNSGRLVGGLRNSGGRGRSPDGKWQATVETYNVVLTALATGEVVQLTSDGTEGDPYHERFFWSPDSRKLAGVKTRAGEERKVSLVESSPADQVQPKLHTFSYYKPGDRLPHPRPALWDVATRRAVPIDDALFPNPFSESGDLELRWDRDSRRFVFRYNQRGHQVLRVIAIDAETGRASAIVDEQSQTFITHGSGKVFSEWIEESGELIWMSERDGWSHLYLYDAATGRVKNQITRGEWVVRAVDRVDRATRQVWFQAGGIVPGQDPYYIQYCRVNFDGTGLTVLTEGDGTHALTLSPDRRFGIDRWSRVDQPAVTTLRRMDDGRSVCELERADAGALRATGWREPERFVAKGRDGTTDIHGVIVRPPKFDPKKTYPVIEHIYAGPHGASVPKAFGVQAELLEMAELGFIVVQIDGMGTSGRSKAFHDVAWKNLVDAGLPDRVRWIKAAAEKNPEMDLTRVGIYGGSAGGQNALGALLTQGDFYHVAVADCGCHDNRMDKIWWNEQWMGWPVGPHYAAQSNVTLAPRLKGKLLLIVGELDRNVDPASTMQVVNALIKADKDFDLLVMTGVGHGAAGTPYGKRRMQDFLVRHLHGREPRWQ